MPFAGGGAAQYAPLNQEQLHHTLYELDFKKKSSPLVQIADLYAYPIARGGYDPEYFPYRQLHMRHRLDNAGGAYNDFVAFAFPY
jgi:hypothetical protein